MATGEAEEPVGYCVCSLRAKSAHLISIAVHSGFRGKGVATTLLQRTTEHLIERGVNEFWLEVNLKNVEAVALYARLGFEKTIILKNYYSAGSDAVRMRLVLGQAAPKLARSGG